jgi:hypothetical protein
MNTPKPTVASIYNYFEVQKYINSIRPFDTNKWWDYLTEYQWPELNNGAIDIFHWEGEKSSSDPEILKTGDMFAEYFGNEIYFMIGW